MSLGGTLNKILILITVIFLFKISFSEIDPKIDSLISKISGDSIWNNIDTIITFERYTKNSNAIESSDFIEAFLNSFNYDLVTTQTYTTGYTPNVYAVKKGKTFPDEYLLIGAHYDSYQAGADAADDNGSGVGALMEIARVLDQHEFDRSVILVFYSGEEIGLLGSKFFADSAVNNNINILSIINLDVIGYLHPGSPFDFDCSYNSNSINMYNSFTSLVNEYIPEVGIVDASSKTYAKSSDHASFWNKGIKGLFLAEELNPYGQYFNGNWHTSNDKLGTSANSKELMQVVARASLLYTVDQAGLYNSPVEMAEFTFLKSIKHKYTIINTAENRIALNYPKNSDVSIKIYNVSGQCISNIKSTYLTEGINEISFKTKLGNGYYIIEINDSNSKIKEPFIVR